MRGVAPTVDLLRGYLNKPDLLSDLQESIRQLALALEADEPGVSVRARPQRTATRRPVASRLTPQQVAELVASFEAGEATRMQLAERYGIGRSSVAKLLRESRQS
ncbi:hypothetical protein GCM10010483_19160 [Actinokineospora diospyrosa]